MLKNDVVVITGACGTLGREFVQAVNANNGHVIIADTDMEKAEALIEATQADAAIHAIETDITSRESVDNLLDRVHGEFGRIDALVNNAYPRNQNYGRHFFDVEYEDFCENLSMNLGGYFLCSQRFAKYFVEQKKGNIVNISSIYGVVAPRFSIYEGTNMTTPVEYVAIKSGLIQLTKYMAKYLFNTGVRVNTISPGGIVADQADSFVSEYRKHCASKGMLEPQEMCGTLLYLLSDASKRVTGQNIIVDDGFCL